MERPHTHPLHVRITHWTSALAVLVLLWSGFAMLVADRHFAAYVHLVPAPIWNALQLTGHRVQGRAWHLGFALLFIATALFYAAGSLAKGTLRRFALRRTWLRDAWAATVEELTAPRASLSRDEYNAAQRLAYVGVFAMGAVMIYTGVALWFGKQVPWLLKGVGGERIAVTIHVVLALALIAFIVVHLVQVARAGLVTVLAMIGDAGAPRRGVAWAAGALAAVALFFGVANATAPRTGVPRFLAWAVPARERGVQAFHRRHHRSAAPQEEEEDRGG